MLKLGIAESGYTSLYGLEEGLGRIRRHGYQCIDYDTLADTNIPLYQMPHAQFERAMNNFRELAADCGLEICQSHGPWRWPVHDESVENRTERFEKMTRCIEANALLGCPNIVLHPIMPFGARELTDAENDQMYRMNQDFFGRLIEVAEKYHVVICYENMPMTYFKMSSPAECLRFVKSFKSPYLKCCLDTGHSIVMKESPGDAVRKMGADYLCSLHIHDNNGREDNHWLPFTGVIDWLDFSRAIHDIHFNGTLSLETKIPFGIPKDLREIQEISLFQLLQRLAVNAE